MSLYQKENQFSKFTHAGDQYLMVDGTMTTSSDSKDNWRLSHEGLGNSIHGDESNNQNNTDLDQIDEEEEERE